MTLTIELPQPLEQQFRHEADLKGLGLDKYLVLLLKQVAHTSKNDVSSNQLSEADLLKKINVGISEVEWTIYRNLNALRKEERLNELEHQTLIELGDKIEAANVERIKHLIILAQLRGVTLPKLMSDLGIKPVEV